MYQFIPYIPYAAVGYCVARLADNVWPTLRSQAGSVSRYSSQHGMDGADHGRPDPAYCPPSGSAPTRNQQQLVARTPSPGESCYDEDSGVIVGGKWDGKRPQPQQVSIYEQDGLRRASIHLGDNRIELLTCLQYSGAEDTDPCGRRPTGRPAPKFRQASCPWNRGSDAGRLSRKSSRWG